MTKMRLLCNTLCLLVIAICYRTSIIDRLSAFFDMDGNFSLSIIKVI